MAPPAPTTPEPGRRGAQAPSSIDAVSESGQLVVGFDLDMTLIDTVPGFRDVLVALGEELGVAFPIEEMTAKLGPPLDILLAPYLPADQIAAAGDRFRALYPEHAIE